VAAGFHAITFLELDRTAIRLNVDLLTATRKVISYFTTSRAHADEGSDGSSHRYVSFSGVTSIDNWAEIVLIKAEQANYTRLDASRRVLVGRPAKAPMAVVVAGGVSGIESVEESTVTGLDLAELAVAVAASDSVDLFRPSIAQINRWHMLGKGLPDPTTTD
jgi:hypothetical protein